MSSRTLSGRLVESPFDLYAVRPPSERNAATETVVLKRPPRLASTRLRYSRVLSQQIASVLPSDFASPVDDTDIEVCSLDSDCGDSLFGMDVVHDGDQEHRIRQDSSSAGHANDPPKFVAKDGQPSTNEAGNQVARESEQSQLSTSDVSSDTEIEENESEEKRAQTLMRRKSSFGPFRGSARLRELLGIEEDTIGKKPSVGPSNSTGATSRLAGKKSVGSGIFRKLKARRKGFDARQIPSSTDFNN